MLIRSPRLNTRDRSRVQLHLYPAKRQVRNGHPPRKQKAQGMSLWPLPNNEVEALLCIQLWARYSQLLTLYCCIFMPIIE